MPQNLVVHLDTLRQEAWMWADETPSGISMEAATDRFSMAEVAGRAASNAEMIQAGPQHLSQVAVETGLLDTYEQLRMRAARLLREAVDNFESVSQWLLAAAAAYEHADAEGAEAIRDTWLPKLKDPD